MDAVAGCRWRGVFNGSLAYGTRPQINTIAARRRRLAPPANDRNQGMMIVPANAPTVLLLHGFPSSSRMWEPLLPLLADKYHLIAPDYPGFGHSSAPSPSSFEYTFDNLARVISELTTKLGVTNYVLFMQDYGGRQIALGSPSRAPR
jgi:pimeloyl-ACP methyl ester carboxylesterase